jgi:hypothetical protein
LTTDNNSATSTTELEVSTTAHPPAPAAEDKKATPATPEETVVEETPEQQEARKQSKFQRRLERQKTARIAAETEAKLSGKNAMAFGPSSSRKASRVRNLPSRSAKTLRTTRRI